jgi:DNA-binding transcriptional MerR regulator
MLELSKDSIISIGKLAELAGVEVQTIRYYESLGLLPEPERTESGYRQYNINYLENLKFIKNLQDLEFKLEEIRELVTIKFSKKALGKDVKKVIKDKLEEIQEEISELQNKEAKLKDLLDSCSGRMKSCHCPILNSLSN